MVRKCLSRICNLILITSLLVGFLPKAEAEVILPINVSDSYKSGPYYTNLINTLEKYANAPMAERFVQVALSQKGYMSGKNANDLAGTSGSKKQYTEYGRYMGVNGDNWCAQFVSWCAAVSGLPQSIVLQWSKCGRFRETAIKNGTAHKIWDDTFTTYIDYKPRRGDLILWMPSCSKGGFRNGWDASNHIAIVTGCSNTRTAEGGWEFTYVERSGEVVKENKSHTHAKWNNANTCHCNGNTSTYKFQMFISPPWNDYVDKKAPNISNLRVTEITDEGYTITCNVQDDVQVKSVRFKTWTQSGGEATAVWHEGTLSGHSASAFISKETFGDAIRKPLITHVYASDSSNNTGTYKPSEPYCVNRQPEGWVDLAEGGVKTLRIAGWARDPDTRDQQVEVHVYVGGEAGSGAPGYSIRTKNYRDDLGGVYGFDEEIPVSVTGYQTVYAYAIDTAGGTNALIGTWNTAIPENQPPNINIEIFDWTDNGLRFKGSAWDLDEPDAPIEIHVYENAPAGSGVSPTIVVADKLGGLDGTQFEFDAIIPVTGTGERTFYLYSVNRPIPSTNICFDTRTVIIPADTEPPVFSDIQITEVSCEGYTVTCHVADNRYISKVAFPSWNLPDDQDDLTPDWADTALGTISEDGTVTFRVNTREHGHLTGCTYVTHIYAWDYAGNISSVSDEQFSQLRVNVPTPIQDVVISDLSPAGYTVTCSLDPAWNTTKVAFPSWSLDNWQDDLDPDWGNTALGSIHGNNTVTFRVSTANHSGELGKAYLTHIYAWDDMGNAAGVIHEHFSCLLVNVPATPAPGLVIPDQTVSIENEAFRGVQIRSVCCSSGLQVIGDLAFADCSLLYEVYLPHTITEIGANTFNGCPEGLTIFAPAGSYAASYALTHGLKLIEVSE